MRLPPTLVIGLLMAAACSDSPLPTPDDVPALDSSMPIDFAEAGPPMDAPTLTELVNTLFVPTCVLGRCHITQAPAGELSFTGRRITQHAALVNAPSSEVPARMRVVPFDPDASYLIEKVTAESPRVGARMPPMGALLAEDIERIRKWILAGALDN